VNGEIEAGGWRPIRLDRPPFAERAPTLLSWTVTEGGWIPTHKAACLINGDSGGEFLRSPEFAISGDNQAWQGPGDGDRLRVFGRVQQAELADDAGHSHGETSPRTHIVGWVTEPVCDAIEQPLTSDAASGHAAASAASDGYSLVNAADTIRAVTSCGTMPLPDGANSELCRQLDEHPAVQLGLSAGFVPPASRVPGEAQSTTAQPHDNRIAPSRRVAGTEREVEPYQAPAPSGLKANKGKMTELPCIHLINLDRSPERLLRFRDYNSHLKEIVRVSATDGATVDRAALVSSGYINRDLPYSDGTLGCAMSHVKLWEMAASQDRSLTIIEDDIVVSLHFEARAREILAAVPADWDFIQWG
jgi:glycosyl transferase family 25